MSTELATTQDPMLFGIISPSMLKDIDVDKMQQLLEMKIRMDSIDAKKQFFTALSAFQAEMPPVHKWRKETQGKYFFASYDDIMKQARPHLRKNGLSVFSSQKDTEASLTIEMTVAHKGGHSEVSTYSTPKDGPIKTKDGRNVTSEAQAQVSTNTYAKRTALCNALDIVVTDEDDNGQAAAGQGTVNEVEIREIQALLGKFPDYEDKKIALLDWLKLESIDQIPVYRYEEVCKGIRAKLKEAGIK